MLFWVFLAVLLVALLIAAVPVWPYSRSWGYVPVSIAILVLLGFLMLTYIGYIGPWEQAGPPFFVEEGPVPEGLAEEEPRGAATP
jgi:hypothetical protein